MGHLEKHNILTMLQYAFRIGYSHETQLIATLQDQYRYKIIQDDMAVLDFSKAFDHVDTVRYNNILYKLKHQGINGNILKPINK